VVNVVVNLPGLLQEALYRGRFASKKALEHAKAISKIAKSSGLTEDHLAAIQAFQIATEAQGDYASLVSHVMVEMSDQSGGPDPDCGDEFCPTHGDKVN
jgi:2-hydroxychromene-2-carboxylate isomerase